MGNINVWSGVRLDVQTELGDPFALQSISKANPAVVGANTNAVADGDWLLLELVGMRQLHNTVVRVGNRTAAGFNLVKTNTTLFDSAVSGTARKITFGASARTFTDISWDGGKYNTEDSGTIHIDDEQVIYTTRSARSCSLESQWIPDDPALQELYKADLVGGTRAFRIRFKTGDTVTFMAMVGASLAPGGQRKGIVKTPVDLALQGPMIVLPNEPI